MSPSFFPRLVPVVFLLTAGTAWLVWPRADETRVVTPAPVRAASSVTELAAENELIDDRTPRSNPITPETDEAQHDRLIAASAVTLAATDPCGAMEWAVGAIHSEELMAGAVLAILDAWTRQKPAQAAALVELLPGGELREQAAEHVAAHWSATNPTNAYIWMKGSAESERLLARLATQP